MSMEWWKRLHWRQQWGGVAALVGVVLTVSLALLSNQSKPPAATTQALLALFAILAQFGSAWLFSGVGKADPGLAESSVAHLYSFALRAAVARELAEQCVEDSPGL